MDTQKPQYTVSAEISAYCEAQSTPQSALLQSLERATYLGTLAPQMISGSWQGTFLRLLSLMVRPRQILEVGTFTGYSAICLAAGLADGGRLDTIELDDERESLIRDYLRQAGLEEKVRLHIGNALEIIPGIPGEFDLVFLDAEKTEYVDYYEMVIPRMPSGGILIADNVLWYGKVIQGAPDAATAALQAFNEKIRQDSRVENVILPLRDGMNLVRKK